jgi:hypothetical protein
MLNSLNVSYSLIPFPGYVTDGQDALAMVGNLSKWRELRIRTLILAVTGASYLRTERANKLNPSRWWSSSWYLSYITG